MLSQPWQGRCCRFFMPLYSIMCVCEWASVSMCSAWVFFGMRPAEVRREGAIIDIPSPWLPSSPRSPLDSAPGQQMLRPFGIIAVGNGLLASLEPRLGKYSNYSIRSMSCCQIERKALERKAHTDWKMSREMGYRN